MKEEALNLADELDKLSQYVPSEAPAIIRRLVEELDKLNAKESMWQEMIEDLECQVIKYKQGEPFHDFNTLTLDTGEKRSLKPLSDEEITQVFDKCYPNNGDGDVVTLVDFAKAIEERHGIK